MEPRKIREQSSVEINKKCLGHEGFNTIYLILLKHDNKIKIVCSFLISESWEESVSKILVVGIGCLQIRAGKASQEAGGMDSITS